MSIPFSPNPPFPHLFFLSGPFALTSNLAQVQLMDLTENWPLFCQTGFLLIHLIK